MRRTPTVSAVSDFHFGRVRNPQSVANSIWYSSSEEDFILISRKRANSFGLRDPHPSTILNAIDSAALTIWNLSDPRSLRGNLRIARRTLSTSSWDLFHTRSRRKSCTMTVSVPHHAVRSHLSACLLEFPHLLGLTDDRKPTNRSPATCIPSGRGSNSTRLYPGVNC